jgi:hypothetical protein
MDSGSAGCHDRYADRAAIILLVGAILVEQHDEWAEGRSYLGLDVLAKAQAVNTAPIEEVTEPARGHQSLTDQRRITPTPVHHFPGLNFERSSPGWWWTKTAP